MYFSVILQSFFYLYLQDFYLYDCITCLMCIHIKSYTFISTRYTGWLVLSNPLLFTHLNFSYTI